MKFTENDITYLLDETTYTAVVWKVKSLEKIINLPDTVNNDYTVKEIGRYAFLDNRVVEEIVLPDNIYFIGEGAFEGCINLKEIRCIYPASPIIISKRAFCKCYNLVNVHILGEVSINEDAVFKDCYNLTILPCLISGLIRSETFYRCKKLRSLNFNDVRLLPKSFCNAPELKDITILGNLQAAKLTIKKLLKYKIYCPEDSPLVDLAYSGQEIIIID